MAKRSRNPRRPGDADGGPARGRDAANADGAPGATDAAAAAGVFLLALAVRLAYVWQIQAAGLGRYLRLDPLYYHQWGQRIAAGDWIGRDVFEMSPLYAYYLGALYRAFGDGQILPRVLQAILGAAVCGLLVLAGRRALGRAEGIAAGILFALYAPAIFYDGQVMKTSLEVSFATLATLAFYAAARQGASPAPRWLFAGGILLGLTALMRENILVAAPIFFAWAVWPRPGVSVRARVAAGAALVAGTILPIAPFTVRNAAVAREFVLITSLGGENFYTGNNEIASGRYTPPPFVRPDPQFEHEDFRREATRRAGRPLTRREASDFWYHEGVRFITAHPLRYVWLLGDKLLVFFNDFERPDNFSLYNFQRFSPVLAAPLPHFAWIAPLGLLGVGLAWRRRGGLTPFVVTLATFVMSALIFFTQARYRMPVVPILCLFAAHAVFALVAAARGRRFGLLGGSAAALAALVAIVLLPPGNTALYDARNHSLLAEMLLEAGRTDEAIAEYRASVAGIEAIPAGDPGDAPAMRGLAGAHLGLARALLKQGANRDALDHLKLAAESPREDIRFAAFSTMGALLGESGSPAAAAEALARAVAERPDDFEARMAYAEALERIGRTADAVAQLDRAIAINPRDADAPRIRAELMRGPGLRR
ncbi:MAG: tetratricopeptide repeat protein [Acidobacteria bacterium]|nr:tetratricopeptide repeat protein [Acidobacteriota bacterium]